VADYLRFYADDPATAVGLAYVEGITDGRRFFDDAAAVTATMPLVLVKGGATAGGVRAAASHTGALGSDDRIFDGACRQTGVTRARTVEEAFEAAATFATQPFPAGPNVMVVTTVGGWGVVTADAITADRDLVLMPLPPNSSRR
jgi:acetyltransferase